MNILSSIGVKLWEFYIVSLNIFDLSHLINGHTNRKAIKRIINDGQTLKGHLVHITVIATGYTNETQNSYNFKIIYREHCSG